MYESGVLDSNGVYRLQGDKLVPHEDAWASIPSVSLLDSKEVRASCDLVWSSKDWAQGQTKDAIKVQNHL